MRGIDSPTTEFQANLFLSVLISFLESKEDFNIMHFSYINIFPEPFDWMCTATHTNCQGLHFTCMYITVWKCKIVLFICEWMVYHLNITWLFALHK